MLLAPELEGLLADRHLEDHLREDHHPEEEQAGRQEGPHLEDRREPEDRLADHPLVAPPLHHHAVAPHLVLLPEECLADPQGVTFPADRRPADRPGACPEDRPLASPSQEEGQPSPTLAPRALQRPPVGPQRPQWPRRLPLRLPSLVG